MRERKVSVQIMCLKWSHTLNYNDLWIAHIETKRHSYPMLAVQFLKKGKKGRNIYAYLRDQIKHCKICLKKWKRLSNIVAVDCFLRMNSNFVLFYLHPQRRLVSHPQFLENSCDVSLWSSAGNRKRTNYRHTGEFELYFHAIITATHCQCYIIMA